MVLVRRGAMKLYQKIMSVLILLCLIPLLFVTSYYDYQSQRLISAKVSDYFDQLVEGYGENINREIEHIEQSLYAVAGSRMVHDQLSYYSAKEPLEKVKAWMQVEQVANTIFSLNKDIRSIVFYMFDEDKVQIFGEDSVEGTDGQQIYLKKYFRRKFNKSTYFTEVQNNGEVPVWVFGLIQSPHRTYVMREIIDLSRGESLGIVIFSVDEKVFKQAIEKSRTGNGEEVYLLDQSQHFVYHEDHERLGEVAGDLELDEDTYITKDVILSNGYRLISGVPKDNLTKDLEDIRLVVLIIAIVFILFCVTLAILFGRYVSNKFQKLIGYMKEVQEGNFNLPRHKVSQKDEFSVIYSYFFKMVDKLDMLIKKNYVQDIRNKEAQLEALQYQINPHFLNNTLEVIRSLSNEQEFKKIGEVTHGLGELFRYNTYKDGKERVTLEEELHHIKHYVFIMNKHYNDSIDLFTDIHEEDLNYLMPKFLLQPLIENAIVHGFKERYGSGTIEISTHSMAENFVVQVMDDGKGITAEERKSLMEHMNLKTGTSIGVANVHQRIQLTYGDAYGISFSSDGNGTCVQLILPGKGD